MRLIFYIQDLKNAKKFILRCINKIKINRRNSMYSNQRIGMIRYLIINFENAFKT